MPSKRRGVSAITFHPTVEERKLLEDYCEQVGRSISDVMREKIRELRLKQR